MNKQFNAIYEYLKQIPVIDTHEHLCDEEYRIKNPGDWTTLFHHYGETVLRSAGMSDDESLILFDQETSHSQKWEIFSRYYPLASNTAYMKIGAIAARDLYNMRNIDSESMQELTKRIKSAVKPGFHRWVLREKAGIDYCAVNCFDADLRSNRYPLRYWGDTELLKPDLFADDLLYPCCYELIEKETDNDSATLSGWLAAIDRLFERYSKECCCVKIALAYRGPLDFCDNIGYKEAEELYDRHRKSALDYSEARPLVDFLFFHLQKRAAEYKLPLKFHTGIFSGSPEITVFRNNVTDLIKLAQSHPENQYIAMHITYPFYNELVLGIKQLKNLYADMCWAWAVDPEASKVFLKQVLSAAPVCKIMGFGGDYSFVENTYGHLVLARRSIAEVLADMVESRYLTLEEACTAGWYLLRGSAERLYSKQ